MAGRVRATGEENAETPRAWRVSVGETIHRCLEVIRRKMGVAPRGAEIGMSHDLLYSNEVGPAHDQVGTAGVAEEVDRNSFRDAGLSSEALNLPEQVVFAQGFAGGGENISG